MAVPYIKVGKDAGPGEQQGGMVKSRVQIQHGCLWNTHVP